MRTPIGCLLVLLALLAGGVLGYVVALPPCSEIDIRSPAELLPVYSLGPYYAITDQGRLFPGQTYSYRNEGPWVGSHTLVIALPDKALFITHYPVKQPEYHRLSCRALYP